MTTATAKSTADDLIVKAQDRSALIGIVGLVLLVAFLFGFGRGARSTQPHQF